MHSIVVANGADAACRAYFASGIGSFAIKPNLRGQDHMNPAAENYAAFTIGDIDPNRPLIHVFNEVALDIVMQELDTITDFANYLDKRARFLRSGQLFIAQGEEDLVAHYATHMSNSEEHDFVPPDTSMGEWVIDGNFAALQSNPKYVAKHNADRISYAWDALIELFTKPMLDGTSFVPEGMEFSVRETEEAVRYMALQERFKRRVLAKYFLEAMEAGEGEPRFTRAFIGTEGAHDSDTALFVMTLECPDELHFTVNQDGYDNKYRALRSEMLKIYSYAYLIAFPYVDRVLGIGLEPKGSNGGSQDLMLIERAEWSEAFLTEVKKSQDRFGILMNPIDPKVPSEDEWPKLAT